MKKALVLIDIQKDYFEGGKFELVEAQGACNQARSVLRYFREQGLPVFHVQHVSIKEGATFFLPQTEGVQIKEEVRPLQDERLFVKHVPNSFCDTGLKEALLALQVDQLVICGMMSHMCVDTTARAAKELGFSVTIVEDACTTRDLVLKGEVIPAVLVHKAHMAALAGIFANIKTADEVVKA